MKVNNVLKMFSEFYENFDMAKAEDMLRKLGINGDERLKALSKGTKEKVQLILVMCRNAKLYLLDEPIGGVDPAARDYILNTIITTYNPDASVVISTHLISDIEKVLDEAIFINNGQIVLHDTVDNIREKKRANRLTDISGRYSNVKEIAEIRIYRYGEDIPSALWGAFDCSFYTEIIFKSKF